MNLQRILFTVLFGLAIAKVSAQVESEIPNKDDDSAQVVYYIIEGDTIARDFIQLDEVLLLKKTKFTSKEDRRRYLILRRKTRKVYPFAKLAAERLNTMSERLKTLDDKGERRRYTKRVQKYVEEEFTDTLKNFTRTEGQILVKLIHRQTGRTAFGLVKELRTGWRAFWYNTTASMFDISLKEEYDPYSNKEDYLIEDILQRSFREYILVPQKPAFPIDYMKLRELWK